MRVLVHVPTEELVLTLDGTDEFFGFGNAFAEGAGTVSTSTADEGAVRVVGVDERWAAGGGRAGREGLGRFGWGRRVRWRDLDVLEEALHGAEEGGEGDVRITGDRGGRGKEVARCGWRG